MQKEINRRLSLQPMLSEKNQMERAIKQVKRQVLKDLDAHTELKPKN